MGGVKGRGGLELIMVRIIKKISKAGRLNGRIHLIITHLKMALGFSYNGKATRVACQAHDAFSIREARKGYICN